ncbi:hypothetical protein QDY72_09885, partial [Kingella negevensis]|uniref:hypothetical protein n=1 Tax=Kingella negevensis TaxID=1522312 RepID=UPI00254C3FB7
LTKSVRNSLKLQLCSKKFTEYSSIFLKSALFFKSAQKNTRKNHQQQTKKQPENIFRLLLYRQILN